MGCESECYWGKETKIKVESHSNYIQNKGKNIVIMSSETRKHFKLLSNILIKENDYLNTSYMLN